MAIALVRQNGAGSGQSGAGSYSSRTLALASSATVGDTLILIFESDTAGDVKGDWTVTDTKGNTWTVDGFVLGASTGTVVVASGKISSALTAGTDTITITVAANAFSVYVYHIEEFSGILFPASSVTPVDRTATNSNNGSVTSGATGTTSATRHVDEVAIAAIAVNVNEAITKDAAYTAFATGTTGVSNATFGSAISGFPTYKILAALATQSATYTFGAASFAAQIVTYQAKVTAVAPTGISTGQAWGQSDRLTRMLQSVGAIASAEAWGQPGIARTLAPSGIVSSEAWGVLVISGVFTPQGTQVFVADVPRGSACVTDAALRFVTVSDRIVDSADVSEG